MQHMHRRSLECLSTPAPRSAHNKIGCTNGRERSDIVLHRSDLFSTTAEPAVQDPPDHTDTAVAQDMGR